MRAIVPYYFGDRTVADAILDAFTTAIDWSTAPEGRVHRKPNLRSHSGTPNVLASKQAEVESHACANGVLSPNQHLELASTQIPIGGEAPVHLAAQREPRSNVVQAWGQLLAGRAQVASKMAKRPYIFLRFFAIRPAHRFVRRSIAQTTSSTMQRIVILAGNPGPRHRILLLGASYSLKCLGFYGTLGSLFLLLMDIAGLAAIVIGIVRFIIGRRSS